MTATTLEAFAEAEGFVPWREWRTLPKIALPFGLKESTPEPTAADLARWQKHWRKRYSNPTGEKIRCGKFMSANCSSFVRWGFYHAQLLWQARTLPKPDWRCWTSVVGICEKPAPIAYEPTDHQYLTVEEEQAAVKKWKETAPADLLASGEIPGLKYEPPVKTLKRKANPWSTKKSWTRVKEHSDDEDSSNDGLKSDPIIDATRKTNVPSATKLLDHPALQAIRKYQKIEDSNIPIEIFVRNKPIAEAAAEAGVSKDAMKKRVERWFRKAIIMDNNVFDITKHPLTREQLDAVLDRDAVFIALPIDGKEDWQWYPLYVEEYGSVGAAVLGFRKSLETLDLNQKAAFNGNKKARFTDAIRETKKKYNAIFSRGHVLGGVGEAPFVTPVTYYVPVT